MIHSVYFLTDVASVTNQPLLLLQFFLSILILTEFTLGSQGVLSAPRQVRVKRGNFPFNGEIVSFSLSPSPGPKDLVPEVKLEMTKGKNAGLRAIHKEQTASRRSQPSSRIASKGELSFPWNLLRKWFTLDSFGS